MTRLRIGELAELTATTPRTIRHYHAVGLLPEAARDEAGYRRYGPEDVVRLVRIRRLRALGMPLDRIRDALAGSAPDLPSALRDLADDLAAEIERLETARARVLGLAAAPVTGDPAAAWAEQLRSSGVLGEGDALPAGEGRAAELVDALHPAGIDGAIAAARPVLADRDLVARLGELLGRFQALDDEADDDAIESLAADYAAALPRPEHRPPGVDVATMDKLMGDRLRPSQRRCLLRVRELLEAS